MKSKVIMAAAAVAFGTAAWGQTAVSTGAVSAVRQSMTMREIIATGGWLMYVLGAMSVIGLALVVYFLFVLRRERVAPRELIMDLHRSLSAGRLDEAAAVCERNSCPAASVAAAALDYARRADDVSAEVLREVIEGEGSRQASLINSQTQYLLDIAVIAPMVGLLGTVLGMLRAFNTVALDIAKAKPMLLAAGVSQALVTTAAGLIVGIPAMIFYAYFRGRSARLVGDLEALGADLMTFLLRRRGGGEDLEVVGV